MKISDRHRAAPLVLVLLLAAGSAEAQGTSFDRSRAPALPPPARVTMPPVTSTTLANGLRLYVVEMHEVPVVQFVLTVPGGGRADASLPGIATFTAGMLDEGAGTRDAIGIASEAAFLGASLGTFADWDVTSISLKVPRRTMGPALELMADVALRPVFSANEVQRQRDLRLASILQQRDQPNTVASMAINALLFPGDHPYHRSLTGDSAATASLDSVKVREFYQRNFSPRGATMVVAGDITLAEAREEVERRFGQWRGGEVASPARPSKDAEDRPTTIFLVDKPSAAQSVIVIGAAGVERNNPDYAAIEVMNTLLGGSFSSRLNSNLREAKGYTYGAGSGFSYRPVPGPFTASSSVRTNVTDSSLVEFFREFARIRDQPVDSVELDRAKAYLALGLAGDFETTSQMAGQVSGLLRFGLPMTYYNDYVSRIMAVTAADVQRVARQYIRPDRLTVVVVGDIAAIRPGIEALKLGEVLIRDMAGNEVP